MESNTARASVATVLAGGLGFAVYAVTLQAGSHSDGRIIMATGNPHYQQLAESYRAELERNGVRLEFRDKEGFATLRALVDDDSDINAGFVKGGLVGSMQGRLATDRAKGRHLEYAKLQSLGRLFYEPIWVFTRNDTPIQSLRELDGKRVMVGTKDSGARRIASQLLRANGISIVRDDPKLIDKELSADAAELLEGKADAAILILPANSDKIQALLHVPNIRLMDFSAEGDAYDNRFPALTKLVLRTGSVEFNPLIPSADITLLATSVALVIRPSLDASLASLLTQAIMNNPKPGFDKNGDPVLFYKAGEFPTASDPEFEVPKEARQIYRTNELPFLLRLIAPVQQADRPALQHHSLYQRPRRQAGAADTGVGGAAAADALFADRLCLECAAAPVVLVPPVEGAGAQPRQRWRPVRFGRAPGRNRAHRQPRAPAPRPALFLLAAL